MPSGKEYRMEFLLNAQLNGGFSGAFTKAQQEFARLGKEGAMRSISRCRISYTLRR